MDAIEKFIAERDPEGHERRLAAAAFDEESSVHDACADALERELVEFTGQTHWERPKIEAAAARVVRAALEDGEHGG